MDRNAVLAAYDQQLRRDPVPEGPDAVVQREELVTRHIDPTGWTGVTWSGDLDPASADAVIAAQLERFDGEFEWKHYSYDRPADLPDRLRAAGFVAEPAETLLVGELAELDRGLAAPAGVTIQRVTDPAGVAALVSVHNTVFGGNTRAGQVMLAGLRMDPSPVVGFVAMAGDTPVAEGRVEFHHGTEFASLLGGATLPAWRGRGVFRALVAARAALATETGFRYLHVDATPDSRPILNRLGFVELAITTPFVYPAG